MNVFTSIVQCIQIIFPVVSLNMFIDVTIHNTESDYFVRSPATDVQVGLLVQHFLYEKFFVLIIQSCDLHIISCNTIVCNNIHGNTSNSAYVIYLLTGRYPEL